MSKHAEQLMERKIRMKKKISLFIICLTVSGSISIMGSSSVFAQEDYQTIVEDYKELFLALDQASYQYDCAIEITENYIEGKVNLSEAEEKVNGTISALKREEEEIRWNYYCKLDEEQTRLLEKYQIDAEEFETFGNNREDEYVCIISNLAELSDDLYYSEKSDSEYEKLVSDLNEYKKAQDFRKGYNYYRNFNYWFANWNEEMTNYVQDQIIPELKSYISDDFAWENDKSAAECKATNYMDNYEVRIQLLSENKKEAEERNSEEDIKAEKNIFETDEFSFEIPYSWVNGYYSGTGGEFGISYLYFYDKNISYKSDGALMHLILTRDKEFEKEEGFEYTKLDGETVFGRSIYMAVNIKQPEMDPEDENFEQEYLKKRSECEKIPKTLKLKTSFEGRKIENAKYSFYLPKSWERNVIIISQKDKDYMSY